MQVSRATVEHYCDQIEYMMIVYEVPNDVQTTIKDHLVDIHDTVLELEREVSMLGALVRNVPPTGTECTCGKCKENK